MEKKNSKLAWIIGFDSHYHNIRIIDDRISEICREVDCLLSKNVPYTTLLNRIKELYGELITSVGGVFGKYSLDNIYLEDETQVLGDILEMMYHYYGATTNNMKTLESYIVESQHEKVEVLTEK